MSEPPFDLTPNRLAQAVGISQPYASQLLSGKRPLQLGLAIRIYRTTGVKLGPIAGAADEDIAVLERFEPTSGSRSGVEPVSSRTSCAEGPAPAHGKIEGNVQ